MRITFTPRDGGKTISAAKPHEGAKFVAVEGTCPRCEKPLRLAGVVNGMVTTHDTITSDAGCVECRAVLGTITVHTDPIFGIEEDRAVLEGRPRVYG